MISLRSRDVMFMFHHCCCICLDPWLSSCDSFVIVLKIGSSYYMLEVRVAATLFMFQIHLVTDCILIRLLDYASCIILIEDADGFDLD